MYSRINRDEAPECSGCPFLEFKDWGYINELKLEHLSFEYHSICNMKCTYCAPKYYNGKNANYDVEYLLDSLIANNSLNKLKTVVWGGGEPTLEKKFSSLLTKITNNFDNIHQRVITNSTKYT